MSPLNICFPTTSPPVIRPGTIVIAATAPSITQGHPVHDGWFLSDFYAFNYLLKGVGGKQMWLTTHIVPSSQMIDRFLQEVEAASKQAVENGVPLLVLLFCHAIGNWDFLLGGSDKRKRLSVVRLHGVIANNCDANLYSTASYSRGWIVRNVSKPERWPCPMGPRSAADQEARSSLWQRSPSVGRVCGSIFASNVTDVFMSSTRPLLDDGDGELHVDTEDEEQAAAYFAFCHAVFDVCSSRITGFTFSPEDDHDALPTCNDAGETSVARQQQSSDPDPELDLILTQPDNHIAAMAQTFLLTCPSSWSSGFGTLSGGCLRSFIDKQDPPDLGVDVAEMMAFRWYASFTADYMVAMFELKAPNGQTCLMWDRLAWFFSNARKSIPQYREIYNEVWSALRNGDVDLLPSDIQGPPFIQFKEYLTTAIAASDLGRDGAMEVAARMVQFMNTIRDFTKERNLAAAMRSESVINTGREMFKALGRKFRLP
ncbi:hypothetical protein CSOJ01_11439 [Colletotrichum sojae]|uniref:Uncharacterized protein n=1 Tax=Colletotrichum sojae TaxID=2175907 RepID=A0A8H6MNP4_9PEZI|nr:hypothetical protein CSOJ01_11439 [Colletotrichum sojae]